MSADIVVVAGEPSGDLLAARVLQGLRTGADQFDAAGIGGPEMRAVGFDAWHDMNTLAVFGYVDALRRAPALIHTWRDTYKRTLALKPRVFLGVDAPDFNLRLEQKLRRSNIPTVHFVGPSIWAWRYQRIHQIRRAVSHMLVLFPFEVELYEKEGVPVTYVGHPLAQMIPPRVEQQQARAVLGLPLDINVLALLPGSRESEISLLAPRFLQAVEILQRQDPDLHILVPVVNPEREEQFNIIRQKYSVNNCIIINKIDNKLNVNWPVSWHVFAAADAVLVASGTATLEAALFKKPMVISYVLSPWMRRIMAWKSGQQGPNLPWVGLPNILEREFVVPELLQDEATPQALAEQTWQALHDHELRARLQNRFDQLHASLNRDTPELVAAVIRQLGAR